MSLVAWLMSRLWNTGQIDLLQRAGITPAEYGDGEEDRIRAAVVGRPIDAIIDPVGLHYLDLAIILGVALDRIKTVVKYAGAKEKGAKAMGTRDAGGESQVG